MNPLAIAFPGAEEPPLVLDIAFGMTAHGRIRVYQQKGGIRSRKAGRSTGTAA